MTKYYYTNDLADNLNAGNTGAAAGNAGEILLRLLSIKFSASELRALQKFKDLETKRCWVKKLDFLFGKATGRLHNIERSTDLLRHMRRIGLPDTAVNRKFMAKYFQDVLNDSTNIIKSSGNYRVRESLLIGPNGAAKIETRWSGDKL